MKTARYPNLSQSDTFLECQQPGENADGGATRHEVFTVTVTDRAAINSCKQFLYDHRLLVEPACGAVLALAYDAASCLTPFSSIAVVVCGGSGVSLDLLRKWDETVPETRDPTDDF